jgi:hypothetical protein
VSKPNAFGLPHTEAHRLSLGGGLPLARSSAASAATITDVMAITKCRIPAPTVNGFTVSVRAMTECVLHKVNQPRGDSHDQVERLELSHRSQERRAD